MDEAWDATTITEGYRALDLFVDRIQLCRQFLGYLNDAPARLSVIALHGDGGNGKSLLLAHLRTRLCRRFNSDNWTYLASLPDDECVAQAVVAEGAAVVPSARFDFELGPRDPFAALLKLRRDLTGSGLRFPLFDFAAITYLHKSHQLTSERVRELFPDEELGLALELAQVIREIPFAGIAVAFFSLVNKRHGAWFERYQLRRNLDESTVEDILRMDHETELRQRLPWFLAQDVNAGIGEPDGPGHIAFFFDNHGSLLGHERDLPEDEVFRRDEWLRRFIRALDRSGGVTIVLAGREPPQWGEAPRLPVPDLDVQRVGDLGETDAINYLDLAGVRNRDIQQRLLDDARVIGDQIHPLSLGLGVDLALAAAREGRPLTPADLALDPTAGDHRRMVVDRLLRYVNAGTRDAVRAVAACRFFDAAVFRYLGDALEFSATQSDFRILIGFSFVRPAGEGRYRVHELLRMTLADPDNDCVRRTHEAMEGFYRALVETGSATDVAEAIYHANRQVWLNGVREWATTFEGAFRGNRMDLCRALIEIRPELIVETDEAAGALALHEAQFLRRISRLEEAKAQCELALVALKRVVEKESEEPEILNVYATALLLLAGVQEEQGERQAALESYTLALEWIQKALIIDPHNWKHLSNKSSALLRRAEIYVALGQPNEATQDFIATEATIKSALSLAPEDASLHSNLGIVEMHLADVFSRGGLLLHATKRYRRAVETFTTALRIDPGNASYHNNRGSAYQRRGKMLVRENHYRRKATWCYRMALNEATAALKAAPQSLPALANKGTYCEELGWLVAT